MNPGLAVRSCPINRINQKSLARTNLRWFQWTRRTLRLNERHARFLQRGDTYRAKLFRKRRSSRAETQQRLGAPSLGSGKLQTPPNRYPPTRLLQLPFEAKPA